MEFDGKTHSLLSFTEDMQCYSFSLPAINSCPMAKMDEDNDICKSCYASQNRYNMPNVMKAQFVRFKWVKDNIKSNPKVIIDKICQNIESKVKNGRFRGHDSGDFFRPEYIDIWIQICKKYPDIKFWFPTRSWRATSSKWLKPMRRLASLPNVSVRPSALQFNDPAPEIKGLSAGTTVYLEGANIHEDTTLCPKTTNGGSCESNSCYTCWDKGQKVGYLIHGRGGRHKIYHTSEKELSTRAKMATLLINGQQVV